MSVLGLALYVYTVGLESGPAFFRELRPELAVTAGAVVALVVTAVAVGLLGNRVFGISGPDLAGGFAGIGTTTLGLAAAQAASADPAQPAVGYAIGYPLAVVVTILFIAVRWWPGRRDPGEPDSAPDRSAALPGVRRPDLGLRLPAERVLAVRSEAAGGPADQRAAELRADGPGARLLGQSRPRTMGLLAGYVGNRAITAYANTRSSDARVSTGYSTLFALAILVKIVCIQPIVGL
ncbi:hypothetical protein ACIRPK_01600 [Kitasatospora sp. NPDC101801]|uniref:aspartate-alanine antiporter-like transporter n=1 Tax=Kitasatospora sp. NPDC101801 TaxID=3364103 RepID=UPI00381F8DB9